MFTHHFKLFFLFGILFLTAYSCRQDSGDELAASSSSHDNYLGKPEGNPPKGKQPGGDTRVVTDWIDLFLELDRYAEGMRPNATARALASCRPEG